MVNNSFFHPTSLEVWIKKSENHMGIFVKIKGAQGMVGWEK